MIRSNRRNVRALVGASFEVGLIVLLCYLYAGSPPPGKNEAHYLGKAKQYWQPEWCAGDFFFESGDAHEVFYWTFGWVTKHLSLPATAWLGRLITWFLFAYAWRLFVTKLTNTRWAALLSFGMLVPLVHYGHLAGEWLIGGIEAKGFAYPLVFIAMAKAIEGRWWIVWPLLGLASTFHVLVGGWAVAAHLIAWWLRREEDNLQWTDLLPWLVLGGLFALPGLLPAVGLKGDATAAEVSEANRTYAFRRLSHHLIFYRFAFFRIACFAATCGAWWYSTKLWTPTDRMRKLNAIVIGSLAIAAAGFCLDIALAPFNSLRAGVLRYYWFRLSDIMVPVGIAVGVVASLDLRLAKHRKWMLVFVLVAAVGFGFAMQSEGFAVRSTSLRQQSWLKLLENVPPEEVDDAWREICEWIRTSPDVPRDCLFLTPTYQQTFKWYAQRPDLVTWKDIPQDAKGINAWWKRRVEVYLLGSWPWENPDEMANLTREYGVTHVVWPRSKELAEQFPIPGDVEKLYHNDRFSVYALPND